MEETEISHFLHILVRMGEALQNSGAEVFRVEDTLNRIAIAYGAEDVNVFVITSSIVVTLTMPSLPPQTETRRLRHAASNDLLTLEKLNALSRRICTAPPSIEEFQRQLNAILAQHPDPRLHLAGSVLAASSFAIFFGGNLWDGLLAGGIAVLICWMERYLSPFCMNGVEFQFIASFLSGVSTLLLCRFGMQFHADKVLIGIIMLLIPGIMLTNSIRDILLGLSSCRQHPAQRLSCQSVGRFLCRSVCRNSCPMLQCTLYAFLHHRCHSPHSRKHPLLLHERSRLQ